MIKKNLEMLKMAYCFAPIWVLFTFVQNIFTALSSVLTSVLVVKIVYNGIIGVESFSKVAIEITLVSLFIIANCVINSVYYGKTYELGMQQINDHVSEIINMKISKVDMSLLYDVEFIKLHSVVYETFPDKLIETVLYISFYAANFLAIILCIVISASISFQFVILGCLFIPTLMIVSRKNKCYKRAVAVNKAEYKKQRDYFSKVFSEKEFAEEIRLYPLVDKFKCRLAQVTEALLEKITTLNKRSFILDFTEQGLLNVVVYWGLVFGLSVSIIKGVYPANYLLPTVNVAFQLIKRINSIANIGVSVQDFAKYYDQYNELMRSRSAIEDQKGIVLTDPIEEILIDNLSFKYCDGEKYVLHNVNMRIDKGRKIGIVGKNGAGKTTLVRILLGLYDNYTGAIYINGRNLRELDMHSYRKRISYILQNFNVFACSLYENIALKNDNIDEKKIFDSLYSSTLLEDMADLFKEDILRNPIMTKEFSLEGLELSGGQKKKLEIARGLYKESSFICLDEPSSALDPLSEAKIMDSISKKTEGKCLLIISHKLYAIKNVDWIYYIDGGEVVEQGTHEELMDMKGKYEEMYNIQTRGFEEVYNV